MNKLLKNKKVLIGVGIGAVALTAWLIYNNDKKKKEIQYINDVLDGKVADPTTGGAQKIISKTDLSKMPVGVFPLKFGDKNQKVYALQVALNRKYGTSIDLDGKFGITTSNAICKYYLTFCKSGISDTVTIKATTPFSYEDYNKIIK